MRHKGKHACENCPELITRITELEAFAEWCILIEASRWDEISSRASEILNPPPLDELY